MFRKKKKLTIADALTRQGVDVSVDPGATLLDGLEQYWSDKGNDIFVNFERYHPHQSAVYLKHDGYVIATVGIAELHVDDTNLCVWSIYVFNPPGSNALSYGDSYRCNSVYGLTGKIVHV